MKTKAKLVLALAVLTAGTAFAGTAGTFAWFSVNRSATLTYSKVTAKATGPNLQAAFVNQIAGVTSPLSINQNQATSAGSFTADVSSGDGITMAKPNWVTAAGGDGTAIAGVSAVTDATKYFTRFIISITNTALDGQGDLDLYLDTNCAITASDDGGVDGQAAKNTALAKWTRVGVVFLGDTLPAVSTPSDWVKGGDPNPIIFENDDAGSNKLQYVATGSGNTLTYANLPNTTNHSTSVSTEFTVTSSTNHSSKNWIGTVEDGNSTIYLGVTVWMEGTEYVNQDSAENGAIDIDIGISSKEVA